MELICKHCKHVCISVLLDPTKALAEISTELAQHITTLHPISAQQGQEILKQNLNLMIWVSMIGLHTTFPETPPEVLDKNIQAQFISEQIEDTIEMISEKMGFPIPDDDEDDDGAEEQGILGSGLGLHAVPKKKTDIIV